MRDAGLEALQRAGSLNRPAMATASQRLAPLDPLQLFAASTEEQRVFWEYPAGGFAMAAFGSVFTVSLEGDLSKAQSAWHDLVAGQRRPGGPGTGPILLGGLAFDPSSQTPWPEFGPGKMIVPKVLVTCSNSECWATYCWWVDPDSPSPLPPAPRREERLATPPSSKPQRKGSLERPNQVDWQAGVSETLRAVHSNQCRKVVLSRSVVETFDAEPALHPALEVLRREYPESVTFAFAEGRSCFLGASPEPLARVRAGWIDTAAIAGSMRRSPNEVEDADLAEKLTLSEKNRREQRVVADDIEAALQPLCIKVEIDPQPQILTLRNIHHLSTSIGGRLRPDATLLDAVDVLHPTPSVAGQPREEAIKLIRARESHERGWYAGPVGWIDAKGDGDFMVALRSALLRGRALEIFAGCGIVDGSDPLEEWKETELKLAPIRSAFGLLDS
ncbi:MAG TPA: isochorismate synthase [Chloroflexota bacterium]|nr:isochorismate synthase [Chloroflexota bacterium]